VKAKYVCNLSCLACEFFEVVLRIQIAKFYKAFGLSFVLSIFDTLLS